MGYFEEQLNSDETTIELQQIIASISGWLEINGFFNDQIRERFERIEGLLSDSSRKVLFLAEFSRGKSELINAIIFGSMGKRLLPSTPGRTTRCTTEIQYNDNALPSISLLPTLGTSESNRQPVSLLKSDSSLWVKILFASDDTESIVGPLKQIADTERRPGTRLPSVCESGRSGNKNRCN